jgi:hypothetical protein
MYSVQAILLLLGDAPSPSTPAQIDIPYAK